MQINKNNLVTALVYFFITGISYLGYLGVNHYLKNRDQIAFQSGQANVMNEIMRQANTGRIDIVTADGRKATFVLESVLKGKK